MSDSTVSMRVYKQKLLKNCMNTALFSLSYSTLSREVALRKTFIKLGVLRGLCGLAFKFAHTTTFARVNNR
jgi:hypothetical protein